MASLTVYATNDDGVDNTGQASWATCRAAASGTFLEGAWITMGELWNANNKYSICFTPMTFDTSGLGAGVTISDAVCSVYGKQVVGTNATACLVDVSSYGTVGVEDFNKRGSTLQSDTVFNAGNWNTAGYNDWTLNAAGKAGINKTGNTYLGGRDYTYDYLNATPSGTAGEQYLYGELSSYSGTDRDEKLVITYTSSTTVAKTITAKAKIKILDNAKTVTAKAKIKKLANAKTITAKADIKKLANAKTITAKADIKKSANAKTITAKSRIKKLANAKTITAKAKIESNTVSKTILAKTSIKKSGIIRMVLSKALIKNYLQKTISAKANVWQIRRGFVNLNSLDQKGIQTLEEGRIL